MMVVDRKGRGKFADLVMSPLIGLMEVSYEYQRPHCVYGPRSSAQLCSGQKLIDCGGKQTLITDSLHHLHTLVLSQIRNT